MLDQVDIKVDEQAEPEIQKAKIGPELLREYGSDRLDRFDLHDDLSVNDKVRTKAKLQMDLLPNKRDSNAERKQ